MLSPIPIRLPILLGLFALTAARAAEKSTPPDPVALWQRTESARAEANRAVDSLLHRPLTASLAARIALLKNRELQATLDEIGLSQAEVIEAGLLRNPSFEGSARFPNRPPSATDLEGAIAFDFLDLLMRPLRRRIARAELAQTELRVSDAITKTIAEAKTAFLSAQAQAQLVKLRHAQQAGAAAALDLSTRQDQAHNIPELQHAMRQADATDAKLQTALAEAEYREQHERVNRVLGLSGAETKWTCADLPEVPETDPAWGDLERLAINQRHDLAAARGQIASLVASLGLTKKFRYLATLEFGFDSEQTPDRQVVNGPTLRLELPIFNQGQGRIAQGEAKLRQAVDRAEALALQIRSEVREQRALLTARREQARLYRGELIPQREQITALTLTQYNAMLLGTYDLLQAKDRELEAQRGAVEATRDYWIARAELERAVGGSFQRLPSEPDSKPAALATRP